MATFRAIWPIIDESVPYADLIEQASDDLSVLVRQSRAELTGPGRFSIAASASVPGSGRVTESVMIYEAPARQVAARAYRRAAA